MIFKILWFLAFGTLPALMILVSRPFPEVLGIYMGYLLGGIAAVSIALLHDKGNPNG